LSADNVRDHLSIQDLLDLQNYLQNPLLNYLLLLYLPLPIPR
jgi:hypothetical protein